MSAHHYLRQVSAVGQTHRDDGCVKASYPDDCDPDPETQPGVCPDAEIEADVPSLTVDVDGEVFAIRPDKQGGTDYTWLSGPDAGYGFGLSPTRNLSLEEHQGNIRAFLADIDPATGYLSED